MEVIRVWRSLGYGGHQGLEVEVLATGFSQRITFFRGHQGMELVRVWRLRLQQLLGIETIRVKRLLGFRGRQGIEVIRVQRSLGYRGYQGTDVLRYRGHQGIEVIRVQRLLGYRGLKVQRLLGYRGLKVSRLLGYRGLKIQRSLGQRDHQGISKLFSPKGQRDLKVQWF